MAYPASIDSFPTLVDGDTAYAHDFNDVYAAVVAIQNALGTNPQGAHGTVAARIAAALASPPPIHTFLTMGA